MSQYDFDYFVIGAGSGGVRSARIAAGLGARTAIAEARFFGGTCVNVGCVPKKLYTYAADASEAFIDSRAYGWQWESEPAFEWSVLKHNKDKEIARLNGIYRNLLDQAGVTIYEGHARLEGPGKVRIGDQVISARHILLATGGKPRVPDIPGGEYGLTSDDIFAWEKRPASVVIVGGGYIGLEMAGILAGVGSQVTLVHRGDQLLRGFDDDIRAFITETVASQLDLRLNTEVVEIEKAAEEGYRVHYSDRTSAICDGVVFATGRTPLTEALGLESCSIHTHKNGAIVVDEQFTTSQPGVYAVGDVIDHIALTPVALAEGQLLARRLFGDPGNLVNYDLVPSAVFSHPQVASVGLSEAQARSRYAQLTVFKS